MKRICLIAVACVLLPVAASAQEWKVYSYPTPGFTIQFPGEPKVQGSTTRTATGITLPVTEYSVRAERINYILTVTNYATTNADGVALIRDTAKALNISGKVTATTGARVNGAIGRDLIVEGKDGSRSAVAIFFMNNQLFTVVGQALPPNPTEALPDAIRFQESLRFIEVNDGFTRLFGLFGGHTRSVNDNEPAAVPAAAPTVAPANTNVSAPRPAVVSATAQPGAEPQAAPRSNSANPAPSDAACAGRAAGDEVQLQTSSGAVTAVCTLVARPKAPTPP